MTTIGRCLYFIGQTEGSRSKGVFTIKIDGLIKPRHEFGKQWSVLKLVFLAQSLKRITKREVDIKAKAI